MSISSTPAEADRALSHPDDRRAGLSLSAPVTWIALGLVLALLAGAVLLPASAPRAASGEETAATNEPGAPADPVNFGGATPTEKFVQSFQQQVSQQLQSALAQSNEAQEARLRAFEQQQKELSEQMQSIEQNVAQPRKFGATANAGANGPSGLVPDPVEVEPPRVNTRRATTAESGTEPNGSNFSAPLSSAWAGALGDAGGTADPILNAGHALSAGLPDDRSAPGGYAPAATGRSRYGEANVAPHGFIEGRLLNGVVAVQGGPDRDSIVALSGSYQSANGFTTDLDGCLALVQGKPEIASGRIDFKLSRLTCNFPDGASRTWDAAGWLVDADGIRGVRATIVDNTARKAAVAAAGGAVGGLGQRLSQQQYQVNSGPGGFGSSSTFTGSPGSDALGGAANGAANALAQSINDYYNLYAPSLQVGGGARVTVVLANDLRMPPSGRDLTQTHVAAP
jgi:conjugal transfer pilus assembly protein TraB